MSIHIEAKHGDIAKTILLPGDPLRENGLLKLFLSNPFALIP